MWEQRDQALIPADCQQFGDDLGVPTRSLAKGLEVLWGQTLFHDPQGLTAFQDLVGGLAMPLSGKVSSKSNGFQGAEKQKRSLGDGYAPFVAEC